MNESTALGLPSYFAQIPVLNGLTPSTTMPGVQVSSPTYNTISTGLLLGRGNFDVATITAFATGKGALTETYAGVTIIEDPKKTAGLAFTGPTLAVVGDLLPDVDQHDVGLVDCYSGIAHFSGDGESKRGHCRVLGRDNRPWQRCWANFLVLGL